MGLKQPHTRAGACKNSVPLWLAGIEPVGASSLSQSAYETLRELIVTGQIPPGESLHEPSIAAQFDMSRTPVREAILKLRDDGLINIQRQSGTYVSPIDVARIEEAMIVRESLEPTVAAVAAGKMTEAVLAELTFETDRMEAAMKTSNRVLFIQADDRFHRLLIEASGHRHIAQIIQRVNAQLDRVHYLSVSESVPADEAVSEHRRLIQYLAIGNGSQSAELLTKHLRGSWMLIRQHLFRSSLG